MLNHKKLLIDKNCPMCKLYGKCFIKLGMIEKNALSPYQTIEENHASHIDMERAKNEIAFYDYKTMKTIYGLDAMIEIIGQSHPFIKKALKSKLSYSILLRLYRFISYNRKVIYPFLPTSGERICKPDINQKYRWLFILFSILFTGIVLNQFAFVLSEGFDFAHSWYREYLVAAGQVPWQLMAILSIRKSKALDYLGNMSTVSMIGALLLLPVLFLHYAFALNPWILVASFMAIVLTIFLEHIRRCKLMELPFLMTASWLVYRILVLGLILFLFF